MKTIFHNSIFTAVWCLMTVSVALAASQFDTLAGFILHELKHIPRTGETFEWRGFHFEIVDMDGHRIDKVVVKNLTADDLDDL